MRSPGDPDGDVVGAWGAPETLGGHDYRGQFTLPHGVGVDSNGDVYVAEQEGRRILEVPPRRAVIEAGRTGRRNPT